MAKTISNARQPNAFSKIGFAMETTTVIMAKTNVLMSVVRVIFLRYNINLYFYKSMSVVFTFLKLKYRNSHEYSV